MPDYHRGRRPANAGRTFKPEPLTREEVQAILGAFSRRGSAGIRNAAMTALAVRSGPRLGEMIKAPLYDLDLSQRTFYVRHPKRDRKGRSWPRTVGVDVETAALLERWLVRRARLGIARSARLFCQIQEPSRGLPMAPSGYREALKTAAVAAGVERRVHPHGLRHTFAWHWIEEGRDLNKLMAALGHRNLSTTHIYVDHLNPKDMLDAMRERSWTVQPDVPDELAAMVRAAVTELFAGQVPVHA